MWSFFSVIIICSTVAYLARRAEPFIDRMMVQHEKPLADRIAVDPVKEDEPIPVDLLHVAMQENEEWARAGVLRAMQEMYENCHDWGIVRAAYDLGPTDVS